MADQNIELGVKIVSNTDSEIKKAQAYRATLEEAKKVAATMGGGTAGSRGVAARLQPEGLSGQDYGQARGVTGMTGASARDFANQAQGLGGLVRLYATYAANLFAATAAFQALSNAMDTSNMVQGLNQLGAASGTALGGMARDFVKITDGAISMREAMEATAKASSSGMNREQFMQLGEVAKKASQALGVDMSDAVSRLTRGITKLEPELLDELGIFTKVGTAVENYARKVGKAESNLTDFERRQAFANAVLEEGKRKFSEIDIPSNPYSKFLAALKDAGQTILEIINKGVVPLINFLSTNPTALLTAIGAVAAMILRQALPAITQYRQQLRESAAEELKLAQAKKEAADKALQISRDARAKEIQAQKEYIAQIRTDQVDEAQNRLQAISKRGLSKSVQEILKKPDLQSITQEDLAILDRLGDKQTKVSSAYRELASSIRAAQQANADYIASEKALEAQRNASPGMFSAAGVAAWRAEQARRSAASKNIISNVGDVASEVGTVAAFKSLGEQLSAEKLGVARTGLVGIAGAISIIGTAVGNVLSVLSRFMGWIGLIIGAYQMLSMWFDKNAAEVSAYEDALKSLTETTKTAFDTAKKYENVNNIDSILAKNNALLAQADAVGKVAKSYAEAKESAGWFNNFTNFVSKAWGGSLEDSLAKNLSKSIEGTLAVINDPAAKQVTEAFLKQKIGLGPLDSIKEGLEGLSDSELERIAKKLPAIMELIKTKSAEAAAPVQGLKDEFGALDRAFLNLQNSLMDRTPLTEFAAKLSTVASQISRALEDPETAAATLNTILEDTSRIKAFPPETQNSILEAARNMQGLESAASSADKQIALAQAKLDKVGELRDSGVPIEVVTRFELEAEGMLKAATDTYVAATTKMEQLRTNVQKGLSEAVAYSIKLMEAPLARAVAQAGIDAAKAAVSLLPQTSAAVKLQTQLELESIGLRRQELVQTRELIVALNLNRISNEKLNVEKQLSDKNIQLTAQEREQRLKQLSDLTQEEKAYKNPKSLMGETSLSAGAQTAIRQNAGYLAQLEALAGQAAAARIRGAVTGVSADLDQEQKQRQAKLKLLEEEQKLVLTNRSLTLEEQQAKVAESNTEIDRIKRAIALADEQKAIAIAQATIDAARANGAERVVPVAQKALETAKEQLNIADRTQTATEQATKNTRDKANAEAHAAREVAKQTLEIEHQLALQKLLAETTAGLEGVRKQELDYLLSIGQISEDAYTKETVSLERVKMQREKNLQLQQLEASYIQEVTRLLQGYSTASADDQALTRSKILTKSQEYEAQVTGINSVFDAQTKLFEQQNSLTARQKSYEEIVKGSFNSMADAMIQWARTGKLSGKDLFNSLIADLARYELRLQMMQAYGQFRNILFGSSVGMGLGGPGGGTASLSPEQFATLKSAKGTAWDSGIQAFAKGGAFTNSIVTSPTLFKFAQGTGLMGEAGPEAIMPLNRDSQGNLGVRVSGQAQSTTQVVVNNYSGEQATTNETVDSKGNRRIEVIIGEAVAREMGRANSPVNASIRSNFQVQPSLVRR